MTDRRIYKTCNFTHICAAVCTSSTAPYLCPPNTGDWSILFCMSLVFFLSLKRKTCDMSNYITCIIDFISDGKEILFWSSLDETQIFCLPLQILQIIWTTWIISKAPARALKGPNKINHKLMKKMKGFSTTHSQWDSRETTSFSLWGFKFTMIMALAKMIWWWSKIWGHKWVCLPYCRLDLASSFQWSAFSTHPLTYHSTSMTDTQWMDGWMD